MTNRLADATSPYLRQHADNPVDWRPWGGEAFAEAKEWDRPIFLSIGYSTCHWCHVMAHESFEDPRIAALLNEHFIPIKLDREERPDVDRVYMAYLQALTGRGGWPLSVWLTPDLKPFYAGTYFPPEDRDGRPGFPAILKAIARGWAEDRATLLAEAERVLEALRSRGQGGTAETAATIAPLSDAAGDAFERGFQYYANLFDSVRGGFGGAPKFPRTGNFSYLLRCASIQGPASEAGQEAVGMVAKTLGAMARGGIHDHVGGGFHRYSVDEDWFVPHFEKMLYDQAQIAAVCLETWQGTGDERHAWLARDILDFILNDLTQSGGGFYAALDADSKVEADNARVVEANRRDGPEADGHAAHAHGEAEGAFYLWTFAEITRVLGAESAFFCTHFGIRPEGNVPPDRDPLGEFRGRNILIQTRSILETAGKFGLDVQHASDRLVIFLDRLRAVRARRSRPHLDDKIVTAWNGLAISAFARAAVVPAESLADRKHVYLQAALRAAGFVEVELCDPVTGAPRRSWSRGRVSGDGFAEDYAFLVQAWLDVYDATHDIRWIQRAERLQHAMDVRFWDGDQGGYFNSPEGASDVLVRLKEDYDGAEPAASSVAAMNLMRLSGLTGDAAYRDRGRAVLAAFRAQWTAAPQALPQMLCALQPALDAPRHVVLTGDIRSPEFSALASVCREQIGPIRAVIALDAPGGARAFFAARAPWLGAMGGGGSAGAYVCEEFACRQPATTPAELREALGWIPAAR